MRQRSSITALLAASLLLSATSQSAAGQSYDPNMPWKRIPSTAIANRGGATGIDLDGKIYQCGNSPCVRVVEIAGSNFYGIEVGDYINRVQGYAFSTYQDFVALIQGYSPGSLVTIGYIDMSQGGIPMQQAAALISLQAPQPVAPLTQHQPAPPVQYSYDLNAKLDELAWLDSQGWAMWSYRRGSMSNTRVTYVSPDRSIIVAQGNYRYSGGDPGSVMVRFANGEFSCIQFEDDSRCRQLYKASRASDAALAMIVAATVVAVVAIAASSGGNGSAANSSGGSQGADNFSGGGVAAMARERENREKEEAEYRLRQQREAPLGGRGGLYGCANPPCWTTGGPP